MIITVFHNTNKEYVDNILKTGIKTSYRNKNLGYSKNEIAIKLDIELDNIAKNHFENKPERFNSNFAWLNFEKAKLNRFNYQIILELKVDVNSVHVSNLGLWDLCFRNFDEIYFNLFAKVYWKNVIPLKEYSMSDKLRLIDGLNQLHKDKIKISYDYGLPEIIIPYDVSPSMIKSH